MRTNKILADLPKRILQSLQCAASVNFIKTQITQEILRTAEQIQQQVIGHLTASNPLFSDMFNTADPELFALLQQLYKVEKNNEAVIAAIVEAIIICCGTIAEHNTELAACHQVTAKSKQAYYAKYGRTWDNKHESWAEFQEKIDNAGQDIASITAALLEQESQISAAIATIINYDTYCSDSAANQPANLTCFNLAFDLTGKQLIAAINALIDKLAIQQETQQILKYLGVTEQSAINSVPAIKELIFLWSRTACANHACTKKLQILRNSRPACQDEIAALIALQDQYQRQIADIKQQTKDAVAKEDLIRVFNAEFHSAFGHELVAEATWQATLEQMVNCQFAFAKGQVTLPQVTQAIRAHKAKLADIIIKQLPLQPQYSSNLGKWVADLNGDTIYVATVADKVLQTMLLAAMEKVYGFADFAAIAANSKPTIDDCLLLNVGIAKRYAMYKSATINAGSADNVVAAAIAYSQQLQDNRVIKTNQNSFAAALKLIIAEIKANAKAKNATVQALWQQHDADLQGLLVRLQDTQWAPSTMLADSNYQLAHPDLNLPLEFKHAAERLKLKLQTSLDSLAEQYAFNDNYAKDLLLFGLWRLPQFAMLTAKQIVLAYKNKVENNYLIEKNLTMPLHTVSDDLLIIEHEMQRLTDRHMELNRKLLQVTAKVPASECASKTKKLAKKQDLIAYELAEISKDQAECMLTSKQLFRQQLKLQTKLRQHFVRREVEQREAINLLPPRFKDFLGGSTSSWQDFAQEAKNLINSKNKADLNKLFALALEVIDVLPAIDLPDIADKDGLNYSEDSNHDRVKAFIVLDQTRKLAQQMTKQEPTNFYLAALCEEIEHAFAILYNKLILSAQHTTMLGFDLLPDATRYAYLEQKSAIDLTTQLGVAEIKQLNAKLWVEIDAIKYLQIKNKVDESLLAIGVVGSAISHGNYANIYTGFVNYQVVLYELQLMLSELNTEADTADAIVYGKADKAEQLQHLQEELTTLTALAASDLAKLFQPQHQPAAEPQYIALLMQGAQHFLTKLIYIADGSIAGYKIGKPGNLICDILGALAAQANEDSPYLPNDMQAVLGAAVIGLNAAAMSAKYADPAILDVLSNQDFMQIKQVDQEFASNTPVVKKNTRQCMVAICRDLAKFKASHAPDFIEYAHKDRKIMQVYLGVLAMLLAAVIALETHGMDLLLRSVVICCAVGAIGALAVIWWLEKAKTFPVAKLQQAALASVELHGCQLNITLDKLDHVKQNPSLSELIQLLNSHFQQQVKLIEARIVANDPTLVTNKQQELVFAEKLLRETHCLQDMLKVKQAIEGLLGEINLIKLSDPKFATGKLHQLKALLNEYLASNYSSYQKPHLVDTLVASYQDASELNGEQLSVEKNSIAELQQIKQFLQNLTQHNNQM